MNRLKPVEPLSEEEVQELLAAIDHRSPSGSRNRALIAIGFYAGLRVQELISLLPTDVDFDAREVNVRRGKGAKQRVVVLGAGAIPYLQQWVERRSGLGVGRRAPLLCTISEGANALAQGGPMRKGEPLSQPYIGVMLRRAAERAGITKRVHAHGLRHSHAVLLVRRGVAATHIQKQLGHASLASTQVYLEGISVADRAAAIGSAI